MKISKILITGLALVVVVAGAGFLYASLGEEAASFRIQVVDKAGSLETQDTPEEPQTSARGEAAADEEEPPMAPDFTVYDREGKEVHLSDYLGKPVVVNFWASWCGPCQSEMPDFDRKYLEPGQDVQFLMINMTDGSRETVETAAAFIEEKGYQFPVFYDTQQNAAATYGVYSIPMTIFIDAQGRGIAQATGAIDLATLETGITYITEE